MAATLVCLAVSADAATITVTSTADAGGTCPGASCTLRQAIATAASGDTINFSLPANSAITLTSAEFLINKNLTISGPGANLLTVQRSSAGGTPAFRIFEINPNSVNATISGLTVANGNTGNGGGIQNLGTLTLSNSTISGNVASTLGGGIFNLSLGTSATMTITNSTISGNSGGTGGGIYNDLGCTMTITNSTISGNTATSVAGGGTGGGGGIRDIGTMTITNSTISSNAANGESGGGIGNSSGPVNVRNTIIALNTAPTAPDFAGTLTSQGYNLIGDTSGTTINCSNCTGNQLNVNPLLGPLQNNSGPTFTHALLSGSTAIEGGNSSGSNTDQRGLARPVDSPAIANVSGGDGSDIGAYEVQADILPGCNNINRIVNNNNDSGTDSLRAVIANVCAGSTITFAPNVTGAINLTSGELLLNKTLTINGPGANVLTVQRSAAAGNFRIFNIAPASVIATISGLTIANGNSPGVNGGGIYNNGGTLTLSNSTLSGNSAGNGAGGGGIFSNLGTLTVSNSTISGNSAGFGGGAINSFQGTVAVTNSTISGNTINGGNGGGIYISGNSTTGNLTVTNSTISGNSASDINSGLGSGGGIYNGGVTISVTNSTVSSNSGQFRAGGIYNSGATLRSRNTIIALNTCPSGPDVFGTLTSENFNLIGNNSGVTITPAQFSDQIGTSASPINPLLGPLQNNGGPTLTRALLSGSPAIDKGNSSSYSTDQRGFTRPIDMPAIANAGDGGDIGAFESNNNTPTSVVSRKNHGAAGDLSINLPFSGNPGIECRKGQGVNADQHQIIFTFDAPVTLSGSPTVSVSAPAGGTPGATATVSGSVVTVNLTGILNAQTLTITLTDVNDSGPVSVSMGVLIGDTNGDGSVNSADISQTKSKSGQAVDTTNFRTDVNADGSINSADISLVKSRSGTGLFQPAERFGIRRYDPGQRE